MNKDKWLIAQKLFDELVDQDDKNQQAKIIEIRAKDPDLADQLIRLLKEDKRTRSLTAHSLDFETEDVVTEISEYRNGTALGDYIIQKTLATGGMGTVYLATHKDESIRHKVAIKMIRTDRMDEATQARFRLEIGVLSHLNHPNIAKLMGTSVSKEGIPYLVMEYVEGLAIDEYCKVNDLSLNQILDIFCVICEAVNYAHQNLIVHRDIKPSNIKISQEGMPKLLDFGIAKPLVSQVGGIQVKQTGTMQHLFSPSHVAPEQLQGKQIGITCDVYMLGILLYELLTQHPPFEHAGKSLSDFEKTVLYKDPQPASRLNPQIAGDLDSIILRCLRKIPAQRYSSASHLIEDIQRLQKGLPVNAYEGKITYFIAKFIKRHWLAVGMTTSILLLTGYLSYGLYNQYTQTSYQNARAQASIEMLTNAFAQVDPKNSLGDQITARQILDQSKSLIDTNYTSDPLLQADLLLTIALIEGTLGKFKETQSILKNVSNLLRTDAPNNRDLTLRFLMQQAQLELNLHQPETVLSTVSQASSLQPNESQQVFLETLRMRATAANGEVKEAVELGAKIHDSLLPKLSQRDENRWTFINSYADLIRTFGDWKKALELRERAATELKQAFGYNHPLTLNNHRMLLGLYIRMGEADKAHNLIALLRPAIAKVHNENSIQYRNFLGTEAMLYNSSEDTRDMGLEIYKQLLEVDLTIFGNNHPQIAKDYFNIAITIGGINETEENSDSYFLKAIETGDNVYAESHGNRVFFRCIFIIELVNQQRYREVLDTMQQVFKLVEKAPAPKDYDYYALAKMAFHISNYQLGTDQQAQQQAFDQIAAQVESFTYSAAPYFEMLENAQKAGMQIPDIDEMRLRIENTQQQ